MVWEAGVQVEFLPKTQKMVLDAALLSTQLIHKGPMWLRITVLIILCSFLFQIWKQYTIKTINPRSQYLGQERKIYFVSLLNQSIGLMSREFANGPGDRSSIPGQVMPKTKRMVLDAALLSSQHYKVKIKSEVEQSRKRSGAFSYTSV